MLKPAISVPLAVKTSLFKLLSKSLESPGTVSCLKATVKNLTTTKLFLFNPSPKVKRIIGKHMPSLFALLHFNTQAHAKLPGKDLMPLLYVLEWECLQNGKELRRCQSYGMYCAPLKGHQGGDRKITKLRFQQATKRSARTSVVEQNTL